MSGMNDIVARLKSLLSKVFFSESSEIEITVTSSGEYVTFIIEVEQIKAVGGFAGGTTSGSIKRGELFPRMDYGGGRNPLSTIQWYEVMYG